MATPQSSSQTGPKRKVISRKIGQSLGKTEKLPKITGFRYFSYESYYKISELPIFAALIHNPRRARAMPPFGSQCSAIRCKLRSIVHRRQWYHYQNVVGATSQGGKLWTFRKKCSAKVQDAFSARGGVRSPGKTNPVQYQSSLEQHTDWVNDLVSAAQGKVCEFKNNSFLTKIADFPVISASNDTTVKVWNIERDNRHTLSNNITNHKVFERIPYDFTIKFTNSGLRELSCICTADREGGKCQLRPKHLLVRYSDEL